MKRGCKKDKGMEKNLHSRFLSFGEGSPVISNRLFATGEGSPAISNRLFVIGEGSPAISNRLFAIGEGSPAIFNRLFVIGEGSPAIFNRLFAIGDGSPSRWVATRVWSPKKSLESEHTRVFTLVCSHACGRPHFFWWGLR